jgi:hypothetical protein
MGEVRGSIPLRAYHLAKVENNVALIPAELGEIRRTMATKCWMLAQMFVLLGGVAALIRLLH